MRPNYTPINDKHCGWLDQSLQTHAPSYPRLEHDIEADWAIVGSGFTGIAAAYRIAALKPHDSVVLLDAEYAGNGASSRNSGFIVDITLNDGGSSLADDQTQLTKYQLNMAGLAQLRHQVKQFSIDCDWDESGKFHCAADSRHISKLKAFEDFLTRAQIPYQTWSKDDLQHRLGTEIYQYAVQTKQGVLVNPAKLINGLLTNLPHSVRTFENTPVVSIEKGSPTRLITPNGIVSAKRTIIAVNALMPKMGIKQNRVFPLTLTASLTRPLTNSEYSHIGSPKPWGVLSASPMGATVRLCNDRRILVRNTVEWHPSLTMDHRALQARCAANLAGLRKRFPTLPDLEFDHTWSGNVCISRNSKPVFEKSVDNIYFAGCYNAGGIAMGSLFGKLIIDDALGHSSEELDRVSEQKTPSWIPPRPLLDIALRSHLAWQRYQGKTEA